MVSTTWASRGVLPQLVKPLTLRIVSPSALVVPNNCVLAIYGDVNRPGGEDCGGERLGGSWQLRRARRCSKSGKLRLGESQTHALKSATRSRPFLLIGALRVRLSMIADRYALELLQEACSDLGSRLFLRIRDHLGLAYYVGAQNFLGLKPGYFAFYVGTMPEKVDLVEKELLREAELLRLKGASTAGGA